LEKTGKFPIKHPTFSRPILSVNLFLKSHSTARGKLKSIVFLAFAIEKLDAAIITDPTVIEFFLQNDFLGYA
jgi:hypothetical protein